MSDTDWDFASDRVKCINLIKFTPLVTTRTNQTITYIRRQKRI